MYEAGVTLGFAFLYDICMNKKGRPKKPEQYRRTRLCVSVNFNTAKNVRQFAASNGFEISEVAERALSEYLYTQPVPAPAVTPAPDPVPVTRVTNPVVENSEMGDELFELPPDFADFTRPTQPQK